VQAGRVILYVHEPPPFSALRMFDAKNGHRVAAWRFSPMSAIIKVQYARIPPKGYNSTFIKTAFEWYCGRDGTCR
jgi:hypothetical protein